MVYVGKQAGFHTRTQGDIHELLCQFASEGSTVLRLKGGDPYVFGRGGEEMQYLEERGIAVHCVPGAALAALSAAVNATSVARICAVVNPVVSARHRVSSSHCC